MRTLKLMRVGVSNVHWGMLGHEIYNMGRVSASLREVDLLSVGAYGAARRNIRRVYRYLASYAIDSFVGLGRRRGVYSKYILRPR